MQNNIEIYQLMNIHIK